MKTCYNVEIKGYKKADAVDTPTYLLFGEKINS